MQNTEFLQKAYMMPLEPALWELRVVALCKSATYSSRLVNVKSSYDSCITKMRHKLFIKLAVSLPARVD